MPEDALGNPGALPGWLDEGFPAEAADESLVLMGRVRGMQAKLHRWAGDDPSRRFGDLFNLVCDLDFLVDAWDRVRGNKGARTPGSDGVTVAQVVRREGGASAFLDEIREQLRAGTYRP